MFLKTPVPDHITNEWVTEAFEPQSDFGKDFLKRISRIVLAEDASDVQKSYRGWKKSFAKIYPADEVNETLYINHCGLIGIINILLSSQLPAQNTTKIIETLQIPPYFRWIFAHPNISERISSAASKLVHKKLSDQDLFSAIYQTFIANTTRHSKGEFYTHPNLADLMVEDSYSFNSYVLDPACGSGTFLLEIAKSIEHMKKSKKQKEVAWSKLWGFDVNPLACVMARANLQLFYIRLDVENTPIHIYEMNALFPPTTGIPNIPEGFDLVIGNPPWLVLTRIPSSSEKVRVKALGQSYGILRGGKLATSTELTTIFFYKSIYDYSAPNGTIFFVTPASLTNAAQHELFRQFAGLKEIEIWAFDSDIFRIHNLCLKARLGYQPIRERLQIHRKLFHCELEPLSVQMLSDSIYVPSQIQGPIPDSNDENRPDQQPVPIEKLFIGRLTPKRNGRDIWSEQHQNQLEDSPYKPLFRQGASLVPRNLLFVDILPQFNPQSGIQSPNITCIQPSASIRSKKYSTWEFKAFETADVEISYVRTVVKSTGLLPFTYIQPYLCFLPIEPDSDGQMQLIPPSQPLARRHYDALEDLYDKHKKTGAKIKTLADRINYGHALTISQQFLSPKVVYAGIGSTVKAAIIQESMIIDTSMYYFHPKSMDEAYFLIGFLNAPNLTQYVRERGSTGANESLRNIHKHPFTLPFPIYDPTNSDHGALSQQACFLEGLVKNFIQDLCQRDPKLRGKLKAQQNRLMKDPKYMEERKKLNEFVKQIIPVLEDIVSPGS